MKNISIKISNYKCYGDEPQGFEEIKPINLIVGRNSSGKSSLLDMVEFACTESLQSSSAFFHKEKQPSLVLSMPLSEHNIRSVFSESKSGGGIPGANFWEFGKAWVNKWITVRRSLDGPTTQFESLSPSLDAIQENQHKPEFERELANQVAHQHLLKNKLFVRIAAERNVRPETENSNLAMQADGSGATNLINQILHESKYRHELVSQLILNELNLIFEPDQKFKNIYARKQGAVWEVFLEDERTKETIALSQSGSGLKTVILVLCQLHLSPIFVNRSIDEHIFAFEELENNLHPALLRRLLTYLRGFAISKKCVFILTTHSSVTIDLFSRDADAQIIHVTHDGSSSSARTVTTYVEHKGILDDLDVRPSDLLQANGVIWVEGPSDRVYLNRYIDLFSNGQLREGNHYQIVFYGGRLLAHLSADDPLQEQSLVNVLSVNRNCAILIDSDKRHEGDSINSTKQRLEAEFKKINAVVWISSGREIEHYLHAQIVAAVLGSDIPGQIQPFEEFATQLDKLKPGAGAAFERAKVVFAEKAVEAMARGHIDGIPELVQHLSELCRQIRRWNGMPAGV